MRLVLEGKAATESVIRMRDGMMRCDDILTRLRASKCTERVLEAAVAADSALQATRCAMGGWWRTGVEDLQAPLDRQHSEFLRLAGEGWGTLELMMEAGRYLPKIVGGVGRPMGLRFYNPATGRYDVARDAGWANCGLPPRT